MSTILYSLPTSFDWLERHHSFDEFPSNEYHECLEHMHEYNAAFFESLEIEKESD